MKKYFTILLSGVLIVSMSLVSNAQYDDLYYNPDTDNTTSTNYYNPDSRNTDVVNNEYYSNNQWNDEEYGYFDNHDYQYTSRIRRFHRNYSGFNYYAPIYTDIFFYDPWAWNAFGPGTSIYISFGNPWGWNRWNRWNRWNTGFGFNNPWAWNSPWGWNNPYNAWCPYYGFNSGFYGGGFGGYGYGGGFGYGSGFGGGYGYGGGYGGGWYAGGGNHGGDIGNTNTYYGARKTGSVKSSNREPVRGPGLESPRGAGTATLVPGGLTPEPAVATGSTPIRTTSPVRDLQPVMEEKNSGISTGNGINPGSSPVRKIGSMNESTQRADIGATAGIGATEGLSNRPVTNTSPRSAEPFPRALPSTRNQTDALRNNSIYNEDTRSNRGVFRKSDAFRNNRSVDRSETNDRRSPSTFPRTSPQNESPRTSPSRSTPSPRTTPSRSTPSPRTTPSRSTPSPRTSPSRSTPSPRATPSRSSTPRSTPSRSSSPSRRSPR